MRKVWKPLMGLCCSASMATLACGTAYAQDTLPADGQAAQDEDDDFFDDDNVVIVTATLRAQDIQDIPIAVTAVSQAELDRQGIVDIRNLGSLSSSFNLQSSQTESQGTSIRIRGIGTTGNNTGLESSVGVFIDGVYQSRPGVALGDLVDLERLEVLRGPQGTLFGRNTSAGALNITTKRPSLTDVEGFANATYGNFNQINVQGGISVPVVTDSLGIRVSGAYRHRDGIVTSAVTGAESGTRDRILLRGQMLWEPAPEVSLRIIGDYIDANDECCDAIILRETGLVNAGAFAAAGLTANGGVVTSGRAAFEGRDSNSQQFENPNDQWGVSGELKWDLGGAQATAIVAYRDFNAQSRQESDFVGLDIFTSGAGSNFNPAGSQPNDTNIQTFTAELRFQGSLFDDKIDWLIGGFYSNEDIRELQSLTLGDDYQAAVGTALFGAAPPALGPNPLLALANGIDASGSFANNLFTQDAQSWSIFTHNVFHITDTLSFTAGARYVEERKDGAFNQVAASSDACLATALNALNDPTTDPLAPLRGAALGLTCFPFTVEANPIADLPFGPGGALVPVDLSTILPLPRQFDDRFEDDQLTWTLQLAWEPSDDYLIYGGVSRGFKAGGFNLDPTAAASGGDPRFNSEVVDAYELGIKSTLFDGRVRANLALFHTEISDFQVLEFTGVQFQTFNVNDVTSTGAELEILAQWSDYISTNVAITYADAQFGDDCAVGLTGAAAGFAQGLCGFPLVNAPQFTGIFGMTYDGPISSGTEWTMLANFTMRYESSRRTSTNPIDPGLFDPADPMNPAALIPFDVQEANIRANARLGFTSPNERYTIEFWGTNIFDERTRGITFNTPLRGGTGDRSRGAFIEDPAFYGVTVRTKF
ncbi:TonB-dependent receptor [Alterisphingorhabdus coralli]|uniref:TonB-dependent receptor n=1 Tax=Alterisphingorhabdus coralli TaxID=3071408 RepID=A0AA97FAC5_9SPHN|nr:TonB-dependent receptor [Parasphingorhabdus sp. SCSIO 66989]WOE76073.1 TonB-dependent receptor [Parasphingorhabdus sp. SCSIO 66989]